LNIDRKKILIDLLKLFVLRQLKCDALTHLPNKTELIIFHDLSKVQKELYKALLTKNRC
jgi:SNF2 family DNA or RNA helicase